MEDHMNPEEKKQKEDELARLREVADTAHQASADKPGDAALESVAENAEDAYNNLKGELDVETSDESLDDETENVDIDFDKELKDLEGTQPPKSDDAPTRTELEKAERGLFFAAKRVKDLGGNPDTVVQPKKSDAPKSPPTRESDEADPRYVTKDDLADDEAQRLSSSDAQRKVIVWHYNHSILKSGNVKADIENAFFIANKGRIRRSIDEIRRASGVRPNPGSGPGKKPPSPASRMPQLSSGEQSIMRRRGFLPKDDGTWESKRYVMRFATGKGWVTEPKK